MAVTRGKLRAVVCLCAMALPSPIMAQSNKADEPGGRSGDRLKMVVVLSRHGVRSPTWTQARLNSYSSLPWPEWSIPPGNLTTRGFELLKRFGNFDRASLAKAGLFDAQGCAYSGSVYIWADTDQRTRESGRALAAGLFPNCPPAVHGLAEGENDPIFHPAAGVVSPEDVNKAFAEFEKRVGNQPAIDTSELLKQMQRVLLGCSPQADCTPKRNPEIKLPDAPTAARRGKGDHLVDLQGPLPLASTFSEDFLLEYADGMPPESVGWGKIDEAQIRRFLGLHTAYFDLMHRTRALAGIEASNVLLHIERSLQQAVERKAVANAVGNPADRLVVIVGHDTNLAGVSELLDLHWTLDGRKDDTPPGTELAFELWQTSQGAYSVRVTIAMQTLLQMRQVSDLTFKAPPAREVLTLDGCSSNSHGCAWEDFVRIAAIATNKTKAP
jgi:4-phytase / acid phosphatase